MQPFEGSSLAQEPVYFSPEVEKHFQELLPGTS